MWYGYSAVEDPQNTDKSLRRVSPCNTAPTAGTPSPVALPPRQVRAECSDVRQAYRRHGRATVAAAQARVVKRQRDCHDEGRCQAALRVVRGHSVVKQAPPPKRQAATVPLRRTPLGFGRRIWPGKRGRNGKFTPRTSQNTRQRRGDTHSPRYPSGTPRQSAVQVQSCLKQADRVQSFL
jgi:hypothetical protein